jgi:hypothetical protein
MTTVKQLKDYLNTIPEDYQVKVLTDDGEYFDRYLKWIDLNLNDSNTVRVEGTELQFGNNSN